MFILIWDYYECWILNYMSLFIQPNYPKFHIIRKTILDWKPPNDKNDLKNHNAWGNNKL